jgi:hypothetical protein
LEFTSPFAANSPLFFARGRLFWLFWGAKGNLKRPKKSQTKILLAAELKPAYGSSWEDRLRKKSPRRALLKDAKQQRAPFRNFVKAQAETVQEFGWSSMVGRRSQRQRYAKQPRPRPAFLLT